MLVSVHHLAACKTSWKGMLFEPHVQEYGDDTGQLSFRGCLCFFMCWFWCAEPKYDMLNLFTWFILSYVLSLCVFHVINISLFLYVPNNSLVKKKKGMEQKNDHVFSPEFRKLLCRKGGKNWCLTSITSAIRLLNSDGGNLDSFFYDFSFFNIYPYYSVYLFISFLI